MAKRSTRSSQGRKAEVQGYRHPDRRPNNPPAGMVSCEVVREEPRQLYSYNPHLDPALQFDSTSARVQAERLLDEAEAALARGPKWIVSADRLQQLSGSVSLPFKPGEHRRVAVKVIDRRGNEVMVTRRLGDVRHGTEP